MILLDADRRRSTMAARLGIPPDADLGAVLVGEVALDDALLQYDAGGGPGSNLRMLPAGPPRRTRLGR